LLKAKMDAGANRALGQFCFDNDATARFREDAAKAGVTIPVVPGIMPTTAFRGVERMAAKCGASIPAWLTRAYDGLDDDVESRRIVAAAVLADQVQQLRKLGFDQFHFYTLNQANLSYAACRLLGLAPYALKSGELS
jgi:methylenetetrahydrofolate reductase (NADPH)